MAGFRVVFRNLRSAWLLSIWVAVMANCCCTDLVWAQEEGIADESRASATSIDYTEAPSEAWIQKESTSATQTSNMSRSVYSNAGQQHKDYLRTSIEVLAFFGISEAYYLGTLGDPKWYEFKSLGESLEARFVTGDAYQLDNNAWDTNVGHIAAGTGYYLLARSNDLSLFESFFVSAGTSTVWELFGEYQDEFSINDAIMTPFGGFAIGEVMYQLGEFFQHSYDNIPNQALGFVFGPSTAIHRWLDNTAPKAPANVDKFGFTTDAWHRFRLYSGGGDSYSHDTERHRSEYRMGVDLEVVTVEKYGKPGETSTFYTDGAFNELGITTAIAGSEKVDFRFFAKTAFLGHYQQSIVRDVASQQLEGHSLFVGLSSAFEYYGHVFSEMGREDSQAICDLVGPSLVGDYYHGGFHVRLGVDAYPTFAMVRPASGQLYDRDHSLLGVRSVYRAEEYYDAFGATAAGRVEVGYGPFQLEGQARYHYFNSIDGLDRFEERVTNDITLEDQRLWLQLVFYYALPIENLKLALNAEKIYRWSDIDRIAWDADETSLFASIVFEF